MKMGGLDSRANAVEFGEQRYSMLHGSNAAAMHLIRHHVLIPSEGDSRQRG